MADRVKDNLSKDITMEEYDIRKRLPRKLPKRMNDVYVSKLTNFNAQLVRCQRLLYSHWNEVYIHGLGSAVNVAINLALHLQRNSLEPLVVCAHTSTVELVDELQPVGNHGDLDTQVRNNSAVHIRVCRTNPVLNGDSPLRKETQNMKGTGDPALKT